jgi:protein-tyrosine phosphatase
MKKHLLIMGLILLSLTGFAKADDDEAGPDDFNLHQIDEHPNGFEIYRYARPDKDEIKYLCDLGIQEVFVLEGTGAEFENGKLAKHCPNLKVVYDENQNAHIPVTKTFLNTFDRWVQDAQATGKKIAFRCKIGAHRTGRLAAYYQMKYQNLTTEDAIVIMKKYGKYMMFHKDLDNQVVALKDFIRNRPCSEKSKHCVIDQ